MAARRGFLSARALWAPRSLFSEIIPPASGADCGEAATPMACHRHSFVRPRSQARPEAVHLACTLYKPAGTTASATLPPIIMLDGLFGCRKNWDALSLEVAKSTGRNVFAVDLRNHGDSPHTDDMDYTMMAADLELFLRDRGFSRASFVAHSMGGRVALKFAFTKTESSPRGAVVLQELPVLPELVVGPVAECIASLFSVQPNAVERLVLVDIAPHYVPTALIAQCVHWQIKAMETILRMLSPHMSMDQARQVADQFLSSQITQPYVREFLLTNLRKGPNTFEWQLNLKAIKKNLDSIAAPDYLDNESSDVDALFVSAEDSIYMRKQDHGAIREQFPNAEIVCVKGAGHWVHVDKPAEFLDLIKKIFGGGAT